MHRPNCTCPDCQDARWLAAEDRRCWWLSLLLLVGLLATLAWLILAGDAQAQSASPHPTAARTAYLVITVTVQADGSVSAAAPITLNSHTAYELGDKLAVLEAAERRRLNVALLMPDALDAHEALTTAPAVPGATRQRCTAIAVSTGRQCKLTAPLGSETCHHHTPDR